MSKAPARTPLLPDEVHCWTVELSDRVSGIVQSAVSKDELDTAARFRNPIHGAHYLTAHGGLRFALSTYLECRPSDISISKRQFGKPFVEGADLEFNLSHSGSRALIAVSRGRQVGVDIERIRRVSDHEAILERVAFREELDAFKVLEPAAKDAEFFALWTRTEALCKVTGEGLGRLSRACRESFRRCRLVQVRELDGYAACVAAEGFGWHLVQIAHHHDLTG